MRDSNASWSESMIMICIYNVGSTLPCILIPFKKKNCGIIFNLMAVIVEEC